MTVAERQAVTIDLQAACDKVTCAEFAFPLWKQLRKGYEECSVLRLPLAVEDWRVEHRTARKRADRASRLGYVFTEIRRDEHVDDIWAINTSLEQRQGRPMSRSYHDRPSYGFDVWPCPVHGVHAYGVTYADILFAYAWIYRAGNLALVSSILGHGDHLTNDVMYLLAEGVIEAEIEHGGWLVYNRHDSGTDGLRYYKERIGFQSTEVKWNA